MTYPVTYRRGAAARGFQGGQQFAFLDTKNQFLLEREPLMLPPPPPPTFTYELPWKTWAAALAIWLTRLGEAPMEAPLFGEEEDIPERIFSEEWLEELAQERREQTESTPGGDNPFVFVPQYFGWTLFQNCEPCPNQPLYDNHPSGPVRNTAQTCCTGFVGPLVPMLVTDNSFRIFNEKIPWLSGFRYSYRKAYNRKPGTLGFPNQQPLIIREVPIPGRIEEFPDGREAEEAPYYDDAWELPIKGPGEVRPYPMIWPYWFGQPRRPIVRNPLPTDPYVDPTPYVDPLTGDPTPDPYFPPDPSIFDPDRPDPGTPDPKPREKVETATGGVTTLGRPFPSPPNARTSEGKVKGRKWVGLVKAIINIVTEFGDFVDALWKALPKEYRKKCMKDGKRVKCSMHDKIMQLGDALRAGAMEWSTGYWKEALIQLVTNEIIDQFYGRAGRAYAAAAREFWKGTGRPFGFQTGNRSRPMPKVKGAEGVSEFVEGYVRKGVELAFGP